MKIRLHKLRRRQPKRICDPACCDHCTYIGEGDFICDCHPRAEFVFVMADWEVTVDHMHCMRNQDARES